MFDYVIAIVFTKVYCRKLKPSIIFQICAQKYFKHLQTIKDIKADCCKLPYYIVFLPHKNIIITYTQTSMLVGNLIKSIKFPFLESTTIFNIWSTQISK